MEHLKFFWMTEITENCSQFWIRRFLPLFKVPLFQFKSKAPQTWDTKFNSFLFIRLAKILGTIARRWWCILSINNFGKWKWVGYLFGWSWANNCQCHMLSFTWSLPNRLFHLQVKGKRSLSKKMHDSWKT